MDPDQWMAARRIGKTELKLQHRSIQVDRFSEAGVFVLAASAAWPGAGTEFDLALLEVFLKLGPFLLP